MSMKFGFTEEQEMFRKQIHDFFINELPEDYDMLSTGGGRFPYGLSEEVQSFWRALQKKA